MKKTRDFHCEKCNYAWFEETELESKPCLNCETMCHENSEEIALKRTERLLKLFTERPDTLVN